jgi:ubiquinone/menaquinone biosynthesis C-methylase UbiE
MVLMVRNLCLRLQKYSICSVSNAIENPLFALRESSRVLKKDGLLLASFVLNETKETATIIDPDDMISYSHSNNEIINFIYKNKMCVIGLAKYPIAVSMSPKAIDVLLLCQKQ